MWSEEHDIQTQNNAKTIVFPSVEYKKKKTKKNHQKAAGECEHFIHPFQNKSVPSL